MMGLPMLKIGMAISAAALLAGALLWVRAEIIAGERDRAALAACTAALAEVDRARQIEDETRRMNDADLRDLLGIPR